MSDHSWWTSLQQVIDQIPHPIPLGCIAIGLGLVVAGFAGPVKSRADRARNAKSRERKRKAKGLNAIFALMLFAAGILTAIGTGLTINGGEINAKEVQKLTREGNERARQEYQDKLNTVLAALNAAKQEQTRLLTDEKIKGLQKDLLAWVDEFAARRPDKQRQYEEAKLAYKQKEIQMSADAAPLISFVLRMVDESLRTYAKKTGSKVQIDLRPPPQNFYEPNPNDPPRIVRFSDKVSWQFNINANPPPDGTRPIVLNVSFNSSDGGGGGLNIYEDKPSKKFTVAGGGILPTPDTFGIFGTYDIEGYEETLGRIFQRLIEPQLIETP